MLRLERQFGLCGAVLQWFHDYLSGRSYQVVYGNCTSATVYFMCSVPQGSVLGPRLFIMYSADLADIVSAHGVSYHAFADDTQMYLHCRCNDTASAINRLEHCGTDIGRWMSANRLKLNTGKSELLWAGSRYNISSLKCSDLNLQLGADTISPSDQVRVLGVTLSSDLSQARQRCMFLQTTTTTSGPALAGCRVCSNTCPRLCDVPHRLLQCGTSRD